jgi:YlmC/YmxH family sporulation protein
MCRLDELCRKDVINVKDGCKLGCICDFIIDPANGQICSLVIYGRAKCLGLFGREDDIIIPWQDIQTIGDDTILVCLDMTNRRRCCNRGFSFFDLFK